jgi:hypothetical protein
VKSEDISSPLCPPLDYSTKQFSRRDRETPVILATYLDEALALCNPYINMLQFSSVQIP